MKLFYKSARWLIMRFDKNTRSDCDRSFETERLAYVLLVVVLGACFTVLMQIASGGQSVLTDGHILTRPVKGSGDQELMLEVDIGGEESTERLELLLRERQYSPAEKQEFLKQAMQEIDGEILGENVSADEVRGKVILSDELADGKVRAQWSQTPVGLLEEDGTVTEDISEEGELLQLHAELDCDGQRGIYECALRLYPPVYTSDEKLLRSVRKSVEEADEQSAQKEQLPLPQEIDGRPLAWSDTRESDAKYGILLTMAAVVCVWIGKNKERQNRKAERSRQLLMDYPALLFQMSMLLNAGLTMQNVFFKIARQYAARRGQKKRCAYEEMLAACYEMQSGIPEAKAYENFGKRCGESVYIKLGSMLSGNLQKGSEGLAKLLQEEAGFSMEERRQMAKKLGEEAGTKLLLPMMLMLLVVLVILMVPAALAF